jgi:hypothetical protein
MRILVLVAAALAISGCRCGGGPVPVLPEKIVGSCVYKNPFSKQQECTDYVGEWKEQEIADDCTSKGSTVAPTPCGIDQRLGYCILGGAEMKFARITLPGMDATQCAPAKRGCEFFGGGVFDATAVCGGVLPESEATGLPTFQQPVLTCLDPKPGEAPGTSAGGKVCTWEVISGATEEGRHYEDYASCDRVRTQRPYYAVGVRAEAADPDVRMNDAAYAAEVGWIKKQIQSTACVCCHSTKAPEGASNWFIESEPNFINSFSGRGLAMGAGWVDTVGFGAYPREQNNGFSRATPSDAAHSIFVTTDDPRMRTFFEKELAARGIPRSTYPPGTYGAGPLDDQRFYAPKACTGSEGVAADGTITWLNGKARYVYVLEENATSPTVPPNLDLPQGTIWRVDVPLNGMPIASGAIRYGQLPLTTSQRFPAEGAPAALVPGKKYYLYVLADVAIPNTRCIFTAN